MHGLLWASYIPCVLYRPCWSDLCNFHVHYCLATKYMWHNRYPGANPTWLAGGRSWWASTSAIAFRATVSPAPRGFAPGWCAIVHACWRGHGLSPWRLRFGVDIRHFSPSCTEAQVTSGTLHLANITEIPEHFLRTTGIQCCNHKAVSAVCYLQNTTS